MATLDLRDIADAGKTQNTPKALVGRELVINVTYSAPDGTKHTGALISRILDGDERLQRARAAAHAAGVPWEQLPPGEAARCWAMATAAVQLRDAPEWFSKWATEDDELLFGVANTCAAHDAQFFRGDGSAGDDGEAIPRVAVHAEGLASAV